MDLHREKKGDDRICAVMACAETSYRKFSLIFEKMGGIGHHIVLGCLTRVVRGALSLLIFVMLFCWLARLLG